MELYFLLTFMICASLVAVEMSDLISSLIALSTVGLAMTLAFLVLKAPHLAMTQLVVEILCVIILIRATLRKDLPLVKDGRWLFNTAATLSFIALFLIVAYFALAELPPFGYPTMRVARQYIDLAYVKTGSLNIVSALTADFRSFDALAEATVLFVALIGVLAIIRKEGKAHER